MDLTKNGSLLSALRKSKGMTQKQVAEKLGITARTVSKWETGHGFPDVSSLSMLADIFEVSERALLQGDFIQNEKDTGNMQKHNFYLCQDCNSIIQGGRKSQVICCGKILKPLPVKTIDESHSIRISEIENDFYGFRSHVYVFNLF